MWGLIYRAADGVLPVPVTLLEPSDFMDRGGLGAIVTHTHVIIGQVVSLRDEVMRQVR
jgi:hypothetical protein